MNFVHVCGSLSSAAHLDPSVPDRQLRACTSGPWSPEDETRLPSCPLASSWFLRLPPAHHTPSVSGLCTCAPTTGKPLSPGICLTPFLTTWRTPLKPSFPSEDSPQWHYFKLKFFFNFIILHGIFHTFICSTFYSPCLFPPMPNPSSPKDKDFYNACPMIGTW